MEMTKKVIETTNGEYMENEKEKVELEDIIGLIKTDEPTNSVQLKKEAQLSICEKRVRELENENKQLKQDKKRLIGYLHRYCIVDVEDVDEVVLSRENLDDWGELYYSERW